MMQRLLSLILVFLYFSAIANEKRMEVVYLSKGYQHMSALLSRGLTIEELGAEISLRTLDIRYYQDFIEAAKERNFDSKSLRLRLRTFQNKIFIDGLKSPIIVANSPDISLSYLGDDIPFSAKKSPKENLATIEKFFATHTNPTETVPAQKSKSRSSSLGPWHLYWQNLLFQVPVAQANLAIAGLTLGAAIIILSALTAYAGSSGLGKSNIPALDIFDSKNATKALSMKCDSLDSWVVARGNEEFRFSFQLNMPTNNGSYESNDIFRIEYKNRDKKNDAPAVVTFNVQPTEPFSKTGHFDDADFSARVLPLLKTIMPNLTKVVNGETHRKFICPMTQIDKEMWESVIIKANHLQATVSTQLFPLLEKVQKNGASQ